MKPGLTLILAHGEPPPAALLRRWAAVAEWFVCADGAVSQALAAGLTPHTVLGDFDSAPAELPAEVARLAIGEQETTDLEKALYTCVERAVREVVVLGAGGWRWDMFYHNLGLFGRYADRLALQAGDGHGWLTTVPAGEWWSGEYAVGAKLSLLPLPVAHGVAVRGLRWTPQTTLELAGASGISNQVTASTVQVRYASGALAVYEVAADDGYAGVERT